MELLKESFIHAGLDCLKILPAIFLAVFLIEIINCYTSNMLKTMVTRTETLGPVIGALAGCVPQCGFSVVAAKFYSERVISVGTLIAVFLATSDEAVIILMSHPGRMKELGQLLLIKVIIAAVVGFVADRIIFRARSIYKDNGTCSISCCDKSAPLNIKSEVIVHTIRILFFLFVFTVLLNIVIGWVGIDRIEEIMAVDTIFQPMLIAAIGMVPNCASSIMLTELYLEGILSFSLFMSGLCAGAGMGILVLIRTNANAKESLKILLLVYVTAVFVGMII